VSALPVSLPLIRAGRPEDLPRIAWLEQMGFPDPWSLDLLTYEHRHPLSLLLIAVWAEGLPAAGYASFRQGTQEAELLRLAVAPGERRRGVARTLVAEGLERLRPAGVRTCFLEVRTTNLGAITFYREMGFREVGVRRAYYRDGSDALVYSREI
jgi:ribosomal-protein-alanine N-acetyltransferase